MSISRIVVVLLAGLAVLMFVVVLRAETTHLQFEISQTDAQCEALIQELREKELELARLRSPKVIQDHLAQLGIEPKASGKPVAGKKTH